MDGVDRKKLLDTKVVECIQKEWADAPPIPEFLDMEVQEQMVSEFLRQVGQRHAPADGKAFPKAERITEEVWAVMNGHREVRNTYSSHVASSKLLKKGTRRP